METPSWPRRTLPPLLNCAKTVFAIFDGIAKPIPMLPPVVERICAAYNRAHENSSGSPRVHSDGRDSSGAGADVGPRAAILLGHQKQWHTDNVCFHISSLSLFHYEAPLGAATVP